MRRWINGTLTGCIITLSGANGAFYGEIFAYSVDSGDICRKVEGRYLPGQRVSMNLLITGIHGFVGSSLTEALKAEHTISGMDIVAPEREGVRHTYSWADLAEGRLPQADAIIHLAGKAHDIRDEAVADEYFRVNTGLTKQIFDYFAEHRDTGTFIFFSSVKAAADKVAGDVLTETAEPRPSGPYGVSKLRAEEYILGRLAEAPELFEGRKVIILRPSMIHGPGNKGNLNLLYGFVRRGMPWPLGAYRNLRTFTSIGNLTYAIRRMLDTGMTSGIYNMADDTPLSTNGLIDVICEAMDRRPRVWRVPKGVVGAVARIGDVLGLPLNTLRLEKLTEDYVVSNAKLKDALGIDRMPVEAREGLRFTIRSFCK